MHPEISYYDIPVDTSHLDIPTETPRILVYSTLLYRTTFRYCSFYLLLLLVDFILFGDVFVGLIVGILGGDFQPPPLLVLLISVLRFDKLLLFMEGSRHKSQLLTLNAFTNLTKSEKKEFASVVRGDSAKYSTHSLKASCAAFASFLNRRSFSSALARKSRTTMLWAPFPRISASFRTASIPFSNSWTSVVMFSRETGGKCDRSQENFP